MEFTTFMLTRRIFHFSLTQKLWKIVSVSFYGYLPHNTVWIVSNHSTHLELTMSMRKDYILQPLPSSMPLEGL